MSGCEHNEQYECFECTESAHAERHPQVVDGCFACKVSTIQLSQKVTGHKPGGAPPQGPRNSWEKGIAQDHRGVPLLDRQGEPIGVKAYSERRHVFEAERRRLATDPDPFRVKAP
jgi:hypothetical protein